MEQLRFEEFFQEEHKGKEKLPSGEVISLLLTVYLMVGLERDKKIFDFIKSYFKI
jgi:hypothetical protein